MQDFSATTLTFRHVPYWHRAALILTIVLAAGLMIPVEFGGIALITLFSGEELAATLAVLGIAAAMSAMIAARLPREIPPLVFDAQGFTAPQSAFINRTLTVDFRNVRSVAVLESTLLPRIVVDAGSSILVYPLRRFESRAPADHIRRTLDAGFGEDEEGNSLRVRFRQLSGFAATLMARRPFITQLLAATVAIVFAAQWSSGSFQTDMAVQRWGGNSGVLVFEGQLYRLVIANFLHVGLSHAFTNLLWLLFLGAHVERLLGGARFLVVVGVAGILGQLASAWFGASTLLYLYSVGASGIVCGLLGSCAALAIRYQRQLPAGFRWARQFWIIVIMVFVLPIPFTLARIDHTAHAAGLLAGGFVTLAMTARVPRIDQLGAAGIGWRGAAGLMAIVGVVSLVQVVRQPADAGRTDRLMIVRHVLQAPETRPDVANNIAWAVASDMRSSTPELQDALALALRAVDADSPSAIPSSANPAHIDTLATVYERLGMLGEAADAVDFIRGSSRRAHQATRARILARHVQLHGVRKLGDVPVVDQALDVPRIPGDPARLRLRIGSASPTGLRLVFLIMDGGATVGLLEAVLGSAIRGEIAVDLPAEALPGDIARTTLAPTEVDATGCDCNSDSRIIRVVDLKSGRSRLL